MQDQKVEFLDDKNQLIWFLQPNEAQFFLAAEILVHKPRAPLIRTKLPFKPVTPSRMNRKRWPDIHQIQAYLRRTKEEEINNTEDVQVKANPNANGPPVKQKQAWTLPTEAKRTIISKRRATMTRKSCAMQ